MCEWRRNSAAGTPASRSNSVRSGRPSREHAGKVDERILDAASNVFLKRGFSGASVDEIAEAARAGKPTIYARFPGKEALFIAVIERLVRRNILLDAISCAGVTVEDRVTSLITEMLMRILVPETVGMLRVVLADARRFPELAADVGRMARQRQAEVVSRIFAELAESDRISTLPAFAPDRLEGTARQFLELVVPPILLRALLGEDLDALRGEIVPRAAHLATFFLAGCAV